LSDFALFFMLNRSVNLLTAKYFSEKVSVRDALFAENGVEMSAEKKEFRKEIIGNIKNFLSRCHLELSAYAFYGELHHHRSKIVKKINGM